MRVQYSQIQKFQLQLFPIDESTRKFLEEGNHCPYLELTITTKKKIASVIKHLNIKWGNSRSASEELILFPYNVRVESLESSKRWSLKDSYVTAAEVHAAIGKPAVFRLRYGWIKINNCPQTSLNSAHQSNSQKGLKKVVDHGKQINSTESHECEPFPNKFLLEQSIPETSPMNSIQSAENLRSENNAKISWRQPIWEATEGVSNMSFGALLSEVEATEGAQVCISAPHHQIPVSCDSFDAAIVAHMARYQPGNQSTTMALTSILDAEETCNPFSFHSFKNIRLQAENSCCQTVEPHKDDGHLPPNATLTSGDDARLIEEEDAKFAVDSEAYNQVEIEEIPVDRNATTTATKQFEGLDMHWPPSASPWQFGVSPQQMMNSDSNGLSGFVSTSMDIF